MELCGGDPGTPVVNPSPDPPGPDPTPDPTQPDPSDPNNQQNPTQCNTNSSCQSQTTCDDQGCSNTTVVTVNAYIPLNDPATEVLGNIGSSMGGFTPNQFSSGTCNALYWAGGGSAAGGIVLWLRGATGGPIVFGVTMTIAVVSFLGCSPSNWRSRESEDAILVLFALNF